MYTPAICLIILGVILLILNILLFFDEYKKTIGNPKKRKKLAINICVLVSTIGLIILGTIYLFMINNQL